MFFRRWDPGNQRKIRRQAKLYHNDKIGKIWNQRRNWANRILLDSRKTLWARDKIRIRRTRTSIGYSKRIRNPEDQSQHYRGMIFVIIKTRSLSIDNVIRGNRIRSALLDWQTWMLHMFDKEAWERFIGLMNMEVATGDVEKRAGASKQLFSATVGGNTKKRFVHPFISPRKRTTAKRWVLFVFAVSIVLISSLSTLGFIFIFSLFLVVQFKWAKFPRKVKYWNKRFCLGYCYGFIIWKKIFSY
ncbi:unnamed protein product, partial [Brassica oleracea var. botrytis]